MFSMLVTQGLPSSFLSRPFALKFTIFERCNVTIMGDSYGILTKRTMGKERGKKKRNTPARARASLVLYFEN